MKSLAPAVVHVWRVKLALLWALCIVVTLVYEIIQFFDRSGASLPSGVLLALVVVVGGAATFFIPRLRYRYWRFALMPEELYLERGILNRVRTIVPLRRIQHLDVSQDLIEREFDLGKLIVHTAGTRSSDVVLPGLPLEEAEALRDKVKHYILEDVV